MGSSLAPVLANIILTEFERVIVSDLINDGVIKFYKHVDDTLVLIKPSDISSVLAKFNSFDCNLNFTVYTFPDGLIHFFRQNSRLMALIFTAKKLTPDSTHIFPV